MTKYRKLYVPIAGIVTAIAEALSDGSIDTTEAGTIAGAVVIAYGVWRLPNEPDPT